MFGIICALLVDDDKLDLSVSSRNIKAQRILLSSYYIQVVIHARAVTAIASKKWFTTFWFFSSESHSLQANPI